MSIELKIKSKHLTLESKVIRFEERKLKRRIVYTKGTDTKAIQTLNEISNHRKFDVRNENRATFLARAYLLGKPYKYAEKKRNDETLFSVYIVPRILSMVIKYGPANKRYRNQVTKEEILEWAKQ